MTSSYTDLAETVGHLIAKEMLEREVGWEGAESPDRRVFRVLMAAGAVAVEQILDQLGLGFEDELRARGFVGERRSTVRWLTLFGVVSVVSAYLRKKGQRRGERPMRERLGVVGGGKSIAVERAVVDFGIDQSFGQAAKKFEEHYGTPIHRTTVRRTVLRVAKRAVDFVSLTLRTAPEEVPERVMVQADGAMVPVAVVERVPGETTATGRPKLKKTCSWREARLGLAIPEGEESPTYVAQVGDIARFADSLAAAAQYRGSDGAFTYAVTDGGNGLRERVEAALHIHQYILDKGHCLKHLGETAEEMGRTGQDKANLVGHWENMLTNGEVDAVLEELQSYTKLTADQDPPGKERVQRLYKYLQRFKDAVHYQAFRDRGLDIGSGHVESGHRHVTQARLKLSGAWWREDNLEPILALRCIRANDWWHDFWKQAA